MARLSPKENISSSSEKDINNYFMDGYNQDSEEDFGADDVVLVKDILRTRSMLGCHNSSTKYPEYFVKRCWSQYRKWAAGHTFRAKTRLGVCMQFDVSRQRCQAFGFQHGDRVATPRGQATVIGVAKHKLWFQIDGENGAWFFSAKELRSSKRLFVLLSRSKSTPTMKSWTKQNTESSENNDNVGDKIAQTSKLKVLGNATKVVSSIESESLKRKSVDISFQNFSNALHQVFTSTEDAILVDLLNEHCAKDDCNPWNVSFEVVHDTIAHDFLKARPSASKPRELGAHAIAVRLTFLKSLNDLILKVLPACNLSESNFDDFLRSPKMQEAPCADGNCFKKDGTYILDIGQQVSKFRTSLFFHTKRALLRTMLDRTATKPKKPDDEYDYPEELPQIMLNRPRAAAATQRLDHTSRLCNSMLGQMLDAIHYLPPRIQRIAYTHPMDDAQQRSFKMKFEGEGVDDYGGPFREVFSQLSAELMSTFGKVGKTGTNGTDTQQNVKTDDANLRSEYIAEGACILPLLQPTPNKRVNAGLDRESFMLNARLSHIVASDEDSVQKPSNITVKGKQITDMPIGAFHFAALYREFFKFVGQIIGIAIRNRVTFPIRFCSLVWKPLVGQTLTKHDLFEVDHELKMMLYQIRHEVAPFGDEMMEEADVRWNMRLSDGREVDIRSFCSGQHNIENSVAETNDDCEYYVKTTELDVFESTLVEIRLNECRAAAMAVRQGLCSIIPAAIITLLDWKELRALVAGREHINIDLLRSCTEYDEDVRPDDDYIQYFWATLKAFDNAQRSAFLRFVWARSRLPATKEDFTQKFKIQAASSAGAMANPDKYLPKAHTCFFSLSLPKYSSQKLLAEKLEYAMENCIEMDADFRLAEHEMTGWDQADIPADQLF